MMVRRERRSRIREGDVVCPVRVALCVGTVPLGWCDAPRVVFVM